MSNPYYMTYYTVFLRALGLTEIRIQVATEPYDILSNNYKVNIAL